MSEQHGPATKPLTDDEKNRKSRRDKAIKPTLADFQLGRTFIAEVKERDGFTAYLRCTVIDAYESKELAYWKEDGIQLYGFVTDSTDKKWDYLVGHTLKISAMQQTWNWSFRPTIQLTPLSQAEFNAIMERRAS